MSVYIVELSVPPILVTADDEAEAEEVAAKYAMEHVRQFSGEHLVWAASPLRKGQPLPDGWEPACVPWGDGEDKTIEQHMSEVEP